MSEYIGSVVTLDFFIIDALVVIVISLIIIWIMWSAVIGAGFEPTSNDLVKKMLEMAEIGPDDVLYDLGSGDGRIVIEAAVSYTHLCQPVSILLVRLVYALLFQFSLLSSKNHLCIS